MEPTLRLRKISSRLGLVEVPAGCGVGESFLLGWMLSLNGQGASCHLHAYSEGVRSTAPASHIYSSINLIEGTSEIGRTGPGREQHRSGNSPTRRSKAISDMDKIKLT